MKDNKTSGAQLMRNIILWELKTEPATECIQNYRRKWKLYVTAWTIQRCI